MAKLAQIQTKPTDSNVADFINAVPDEQKRNDAFTVLMLMEKATGEKPKMWGTSLIGFGNLRYKSPKTGREVEWFKIGFSPRKANLSIHLAIDLGAHQQSLLLLGKHKTGVGCLYITRLSDVSIAVLENLIKVALKNK